MSLMPVDTTNAVAVTSYLQQAREWLTRAVHETGPEEIAAAKAEIATAAEATKQLNLSKDIQLDAQEMVRRAEYALGKAIRRGQEEGTVRTTGQTVTRYGGREGQPRGAFDPAVQHTDNTIASPTDFATMNELSGYHANGIYALADDVDPVEFDEALDEAKNEGNLSRANVIRKVKKVSGVITRDMRADLIADLAEQGYSSRQMPAKVGVTEKTVREIARDFDIEIPADKIIGRSRRINWTDAVASTISGLQDSVEFIEGQIDLSQVDFTEADEWVSSLTSSIAALNRFKQQIKEKTHV